MAAAGLFALALFVAPASAQAPAKGPDLQLVDVGRVVDWRPGGPRLIYIKDTKAQWYRVDLVEPCMDLYPGKEPSFVTLTDTSGTRYSGVVIEHRQCSVIKVAKMDEPPPAEAYAPPSQKPAAKSAPTSNTKK